MSRVPFIIHCQKSLAYIQDIAGYVVADIDRGLAYSTQVQISIESAVKTRSVGRIER